VVELVSRASRIPSSYSVFPGDQEQQIGQHARRRALAQVVHHPLDQGPAHLGLAQEQRAQAQPGGPQRIVGQRPGRRQLLDRAADLLGPAASGQHPGHPLGHRAQNPGSR
jgi:hypothetical protein